jgi:hypothetical protein
MLPSNENLRPVETRLPASFRDGPKLDLSTRLTIMRLVVAARRCGC